MWSEFRLVLEESRLRRTTGVCHLGFCNLAKHKIIQEYAQQKVNSVNRSEGHAKHDEIVKTAQVMHENLTRHLASPTLFTIAVGIDLPKL